MALLKMIAESFIENYDFRITEQNMGQHIFIVCVRNAASCDGWPSSSVKHGVSSAAQGI